MLRILDDIVELHSDLRWDTVIVIPSDDRVVRIHPVFDERRDLVKVRGIAGHIENWITRIVVLQFSGDPVEIHIPHHDVGAEPPLPPFVYLTACRDAQGHEAHDDLYIDIVVQVQHLGVNCLVVLLEPHARLMLMIIDSRNGWNGVYGMDINICRNNRPEYGIQPPLNTLIPLMWTGWMHDARCALRQGIDG